MANITVIGGTGYTGSNIVAELASRGHRVTSFSRKAAPSPVEGVTYLHGDATDLRAIAAAVEGADVVIGSLAPRGELAGKVAGIYQQLPTLAKTPRDRLILIGGWSSLRPAKGAPRFTEGDGVPEQFRAEAQEMAGVVDWLEAADRGVDWLFVSPAAVYGSFAPGERTGAYRVGDEVALQAPDGSLDTEISGADFAKAVADEVEEHKLKGHVSFVH